MSVALRILLLTGAVGMFLFVFKGVKKARFRAQETFFWLLTSLVFVLLSAFPAIAGWAARLLGVASTVNLVFLLVIFLLLVKVFATDRKLAKTEHQMSQLIQKMAIDELKEKREAEGETRE